MCQCNIPVVLLLFKRSDTSLQIIDRIRQAGVKKLYIMSDAGRTLEEIEKVSKAREIVKNAINWDCEVVYNYAEVNRGVFGNIALGAKWVFQREATAIFLEDDNLPEVTFFRFCEEMLERYKNDTRVLWICGTNYLGKSQAENDASYYFTKHMLPCGWASWGDKFCRFYDGTVQLLDDPYTAKRVLAEYSSVAVSNVYMRPLSKYQEFVKTGKNPSSWDYQMSLSIRANSMFGISPVCNQIKNIGVDMDSEHGGNSMTKIMTRRFCGMESYPLQFPLKHPLTIMADLKYEKAIDNIVTPPWIHRWKSNISIFAKKLLGQPYYISWKQILKGNNP